MNEIPSIKTHPVLMSLVTIIVVLAILVGGIISGWFLRAAMESKAELSVVVDDNVFMQKLETKVQQWVGDFQDNQANFYEEHTEIPYCLAGPMPNYYHNNDYSVRPERESEGGLFDE